jgi:hypothetical protein
MQRALRAFANLSVARKLQLTIATTLVGLVLLVTMAMRTAGSIGDELSGVGRQQLPAVRNMTLVDMMHDGIRAGVYGILIAQQKNDGDAMQAAETELKDLCGNLREYAANIEKLEIAAETRDAIEQAKPAIEAYVTGALSIGTLAKSNQAEPLAAAMTTFETQFSVLEERLEMLGELIEGDADEAVTRGEAVAASATWQSLLMLGLIGGVSVAFSAFVGRRPSFASRALRIEASAAWTAALACSLACCRSCAAFACFCSSCAASCRWRACSSASCMNLDLTTYLPSSSCIYFCCRRAGSSSSSGKPGGRATPRLIT